MKTITDTILFEVYKNQLKASGWNPTKPNWQKYEMKNDVSQMGFCANIEWAFIQGTVFGQQRYKQIIGKEFLIFLIWYNID